MKSGPNIDAPPGFSEDYEIDWGYMEWSMKPGGLPGIKEFQIAHPPQKRFSKLQIRYIEIDETVRGQGLGRSAYITVEKWAVKHGCQVVELESFAKSIGFWLRLGFDPIKMNFDGYLVMRRDTSSEIPPPGSITNYYYTASEERMDPIRHPVLFRDIDDSVAFAREKGEKGSLRSFSIPVPSWMGSGPSVKFRTALPTLGITVVREDPPVAKLPKQKLSATRFSEHARTILFESIGDNKLLSLLSDVIDDEQNSLSAVSIDQQIKKTKAGVRVTFSGMQMDRKAMNRAGEDLEDVKMTAFVKRPDKEYEIVVTEHDIIDAAWQLGAIDILRIIRDDGTFSYLFKPSFRPTPEDNQVLLKHWVKTYGLRPDGSRSPSSNLPEFRKSKSARSVLRLA